MGEYDMWVDVRIVREAENNRREGGGWLGRSERGWGGEGGLD